MTAELERAWHWREKRGLLSETQALRIFHGPGEGTGDLAELAIDRFGPHFWVTEWGGRGAETAIARFLEQRGAASVVVLPRPRPEAGKRLATDISDQSVRLFGQPPAGPFEVDEAGARFWIRFEGTRHPGLFLDHAPLRRWLRSRARGWRTLNAFAYTGSLSVAAGLGGASETLTLDLSRQTMDWAAANWKLNDLPESAGQFVAGDVFEWLPKLKRLGREFDCVILDPPSFSRGKKGVFTTSKDLTRLHELAIDLLAPRGVLVTSINSANVTVEKYRADVQKACGARGVAFDVLAELGLPESFPTRLDRPADRYLKGWILRMSEGKGASKRKVSPVIG